jgi:hypothetical protein
MLQKRQEYSKIAPKQQKGEVRKWRFSNTPILRHIRKVKYLI